MTDIRISDAAAQSIARDHDEAANAINNTAKSLPPGNIDAGAGSAYLMQLLSKITGDCSQLANANSGTAAIMRQVVADYYKTDEAAADDLGKLAKKIESTA